jgi:hypothetical protein
MPVIKDVDLVRPKGKPPAWLGSGGVKSGMTRKKPFDKLNELGPTMGMGGGGQTIPSFITPASTAQGQARRRAATMERVSARDDPRRTPSPTYGVGRGGVSSAMIQANRERPLPDWLTNLFVPRAPAYGGTYDPTNLAAQDAMSQGTEVGPIAWAYNLSQTHPPGGRPLLLPEPEDDYGGFGTRYKRWGRGGGDGDGGGYVDYNRPPDWLTNLYQWNYKG